MIQEIRSRIAKLLSEIRQVDAVVQNILRSQQEVLLFNVDHDQL